jgi:hypothetical protein
MRARLVQAFAHRGKAFDQLRRLFPSHHQPRPRQPLRRPNDIAADGQPRKN